MGLLVFLLPIQLYAAEISDASAECLDCHAGLAPGLIAGWQNSRHARTSPEEALKKAKLERRLSAQNVPEALAKSVVGNARDIQCIDAIGLSSKICNSVLAKILKLNNIFWLCTM